MTNEEKHLISECRMIIIGPQAFTGYVNTELRLLGFRHIQINDEKNCLCSLPSVNIIAEYGDNGFSQMKDINEVESPLIYAFDFVKGTGAIVVMPGVDRELCCKKDIRLWAAEYMAGYCGFWNMADCDWLGQSIPAIRKGKTEEAAQKTAAHICARIAANIAVGREVKHFPRFYLCRNLE